MVDGTELPRLRSLLGESASLWAPAVRVEADRWVALSGAPSVGYNLIVCHGSDAGAALSESVEEIAAAGVPGIVMAAGPALGDVQQLARRSWTCIGSVSVMWLPLAAEDTGATASGAVTARRLAGAELQPARELVQDAFGLGAELARVALPPDAADRPGISIWGLFDKVGELVSCLAAVEVGGVVCIWSMATLASERRRGRGAALLGAVLADARTSGAEGALLYAAAPHAERFYRALGFGELERWQSWSRPRWVLGRA